MSNEFNEDAPGLAQPHLSNATERSVDDKSRVHRDWRSNEPTAENVGQVARRGEHRLSRQGSGFERGMRIEKIRVELFILEAQEGFEHRSYKAKMLEVAMRGSDEVREWFYINGANGKFPTDWEGFKERLIEFCACEGINSLVKYQDEEWSLFILRLQDWVAARRYPETMVWERLRGMRTPSELRILVSVANISIGELVSTVRQWERTSWSYKGTAKVFGRGQPPRREVPRGASASRHDFSKILCYNCNQLGHYASHCKEARNTRRGSNQLNMIQEIADDENVDYRSMRLNDVDCSVLFDTGASASFISPGAVGVIGSDDKLRSIPEKRFRLVAGIELRSTSSMEVRSDYKGRRFIETFYVLENVPGAIFILGNKRVKELNEPEGAGRIPIECTIDTGKATPISWTRPIRSRKDKEDFQELITRLESEGIVESSVSRWLNPVVLVRKKNGDLRFCVDFRKLNELVVQDGYELPRIPELIGSLHGNHYFSSLDLKDGFYQVPIATRDKEKTAFYTGERLMQFTRMPQGYRNSPAIFQRVMTLVLEGLIGKACLVYIDDILIFGKTETEHDDNFKRVLERLEKYGLKENIDKRCYKQREIEFLGYCIKNGRYEPKVGRAQGIVDYKRPANRKELQRFLGLLNYDRVFVKKLSEIALPLYGLLEKEKGYTWEEQHEEAFNQLKKKWSEGLQLIIPDPNKGFTLETDASQEGIGAALLQDGQPVAYISRTLTKSERAYGITERETLAALWAMEKLQYQLLGRKFMLVTDHKALEFMKEKKEFGSHRIQRWAERFGRFEFEVVYRKGEDMVQADALSRGATRSEGSIEEVLEIHRDRCHRKNLKKALEHKGLELSAEKIREILKKCEVCQHKDISSARTSHFVKTSAPGELVGIDLMEYSEQENVCVVIDYFSRKVFAAVILTKRSEGVIRLLNKVYGELRFTRILADNGREFANRELRKWADERGVVLEFATPYYHQGNGRVERVIRTLRDGLKRVPGMLRIKLQRIVEVYNSQFHRGIGMTPNEALLEVNRSRVIDAQNKYAKMVLEAGRTVDKFTGGEDVLIRNEFRRTKMDDAFTGHGKIVRPARNDTYEVLREQDKRRIIRHISQLRRV